MSSSQLEKKLITHARRRRADYEHPSSRVGFYIIGRHCGGDLVAVSTKPCCGGAPDSSVVVASAVGRRPIAHRPVVCRSCCEWLDDPAKLGGDGVPELGGDGI
jgi:hypothetical protein